MKLLKLVIVVRVLCIIPSPEKLKILVKIQASLPPIDDLTKTYFDRDIEKAFMTHSKTIFQTKTQPSLLIATNVGNMYTPSLYGGLVSYLCEEPAPANRRIALFSYGSGLASSFFSLRIKEGPALVRLLDGLSDVKPLLEARTKISPADFSATMKHREDTHHCAPFQPSGEVSTLSPETWYLESVDELHRRTYKKKSGHQVAQNGHA
jgi:hydroxymethylglutaryl-CoA synthase